MVEVELTDKERALQYVIYAMMASYFNNSTESIEVASTIRESALRTSYNCLKRDMQILMEDSIIYYIENKVLCDLNNEMLSDHTTMRFKQSFENNKKDFWVEFDAYFWKLEIHGEVDHNKFYFKHRIIELTEDEE